MYCRIGHSSKHHVKLGDKVKKGDLVAEVGTGNGQWSAHCHCDFPLVEMKSWTGYVFGWMKDEVAKGYADPKPYRQTAFPEYDHMGWGYLELATYGTKKCYHPGEDWNGKGAGNADFGNPIYAPFDGEVVFDFDDGSATNGGWGRLLVIKETPKIEPQQPETPLTTLDTTSEEKPPTAPNLAPETITVDYHSAKAEADQIKNILEALIIWIKNLFRK